MSDRLHMPSRKFHRGIGMLPGSTSINGVPLSAEQWEKRMRLAAIGGRHQYPAQHHGQAGVRAGQVRDYIAPPRRGINQLSIDFDACEPSDSLLTLLFMLWNFDPALPEALVVLSQGIPSFPSRAAA
jgi:hypothetical protein